MLHSITKTLPNGVIIAPGEVDNSSKKSYYHTKHLKIELFYATFMQLLCNFYATFMQPKRIVLLGSECKYDHKVVYIKLGYIT